MNAEHITCDWDENGCYLTVQTDRFSYLFRIEDPEQLYDRVKTAIGPWLAERDMARLAHPVFACNPDESGGYALTDPKHPDYHDAMADMWDSREGK